MRILQQMLVLSTLLLTVACQSVPPSTAPPAPTASPTLTQAPATATRRSTITPSPTLQPFTPTPSPSATATVEPAALIQPLLAETLNDGYSVLQTYFRSTEKDGGALVLETRYQSTSRRIMPSHARLFVQLLDLFPEIDAIWFSADGDDPYSVVAQADDLRLYAKGELDDFELMLRMEVAYEEHKCDC